MSLVPGTRIGPYEIVSMVGAGGMGEVYRARDTSLKRDVALKTLPESFASDSERLARFQREAELLASLNHPNIAAIYGLAEGDGVKALVMELVGGEDLADRIAHGPIAVDEALPIARQIADALEAAHERGIIHRDLKPANIKLGGDGTVKVLDFGLAKAIEPAGAMSPGMAQSPTITSPAMMTGLGMLLGTAAYMSPEQARGKPVDKRADIWGFGCVLFEMLTGQRAFAGDDVSDTLANVLKQDPNWRDLPENCPPSIRRLLRRCLTRDPAERLADVGTARLDIKDADSEAATPATVVAGVVPGPHRARWIRLAGQLTVLLLCTALAGATAWYLREPRSSSPSQFLVVPPPGASLTAIAADRELVLSRDGRRIVYVGNNGTQLFVRNMAALEPRPLPDLGTPRGPFLSPDGEWVGFFDGRDSTLKKVAVSGGPPTPLGKYQGQRGGATWGDDGTIVFATQGMPSTGLWTVPGGGGEPVVLTTPDSTLGEAAHLWPEFVPGRPAVLFTILATNGGLPAAQIAIRDLRTGAQKILLRGGTHGRYVTSGHLVYAVDGALLAVPFDPANWTFGDAPRPVLSDVVTTASGAANFDVAEDGTLVYVPATLDGPNTSERRLVWVSRDGREQPIASPPRAYGIPRLSPDESRVAVDILGQEGGIWIWDFARDTLSRATAGPIVARSPAWTSQGQIVFLSYGPGGFRLIRQSVDNPAGAEPLSVERGNAIPYSVSKDQMLIFGYGPRELRRMSLTGDRRETSLIVSPDGGSTTNGEVSPDGRWLAYQSTDAGPGQHTEVYVSPYPDVNGGKWQVSNAGGSRPCWSKDGKELFYVGATGTLMRVTVAPGETWSPTKPERLLDRVYLVGQTPLRTYDVAKDGRRFLMVTSNQTEPARLAEGELRRSEAGIVVFTNWLEELKRLVPTK